MTTEKPENYDLEPADALSGSDESPIPQPRRPDIERPADVEPLPLEPDDDGDAPAQQQQQHYRVGQPLNVETPEAEPEKRESDDEPLSGPPKSVRELDVCPNCGAPMRQSDSLVCLRCGFDLKTMRKLETVSKRASGDDDDSDAADEGDESAQEQPPLVEPGSGDLWLPGAMAAISGLILIIGYFAAVRGLYLGIEATAMHEGVPFAVSAGARFIAVLKFIGFAAIWTACGVGALAFLASLLGVRLVADFSDMRLAVVRMANIILTAQLATFINLAQPWLEWLAEAVLQAGIFVGLSMAFFRLPPRDAGILALATLVLFIGLWVAAHAIVWVAG